MGGEADKYLASDEHRGAQGKLPQRLISSHEPCLSVAFNGVCVHTHTKTHTYIHPCLKTHIHTSIHAYIHTCIHPHSHITFVTHTCTSPLHSFIYTRLHLHSRLYSCPELTYIHNHQFTFTSAFTYSQSYTHTCSHTHIHNQTHIWAHFHMTTLILTLVFTLTLTPIHPHSLTHLHSNSLSLHNFLPPLPSDAHVGFPVSPGCSVASARLPPCEHPVPRSSKRSEPGFRAAESTDRSTTCESS